MSEMELGFKTLRCSLLRGEGSEEQIRRRANSGELNLLFLNISRPNIQGLKDIYLLFKILKCVLSVLDEITAANPGQ